ncbi:hypothetical protein ACH4TQ_49680 [Streptomyces sp. NPDC021218]|uniref:hypothetical protein n=1 Tax=Streptomyces sp. NPDC021218 TaxID=3365119 RepID=UPI003789D576
MTHRDRQGQQIELMEWADLWDNMAYRVVAEGRVGDVLVRTVWEGIDDVPAAMFATGTSRDGGAHWQTERTDARTEPEARVQHDEVVEDLRRRSGSSK